LRRRGALEKTGITHIVSVLKYDFKDFEDWEKYEHLSVEVDDVEDENLLGEFERTGKFIEDGLKSGKDGKKGGVLVHWYVNSVFLYCYFNVKSLLLSSERKWNHLTFSQTPSEIWISWSIINHFTIIPRSCEDALHSFNWHKIHF
jgi:hypothetical protein